MTGTEETAKLLVESWEKAVAEATPLVLLTPCLGCGDLRTGANPDLGCPCGCGCMGEECVCGERVEP